MKTPATLGATLRASIGTFAFLLACAPATAKPVVAATLQADTTRWDDASKAALQAALADRARHGLDKVAFLDSPDTATDTELSAAALRYAYALAQGLVDPTTLHDPFTLSRSGTKLEAGLAKAVAEHRLDEWLAGLAPQDAEYAQLSQAYRDLRAMPDITTAIGPGVIKVGQSDPRVPAIVGRLSSGGYLPADFSGNAALYTRQVADAVAALQRDNGMVADGIVGPDTLDVLNRKPADRARAIAVALERRRWLDRSPPPTRIDVNTAAAELQYFRDNVLVDTRRVVVGASGTETPPLQSPIYRLVANPTWTVPKSIQNGELANVGAEYLAANNMELRDGWIVQGSGPDNALGLVKFDMSNAHAIYLHDTSAPELFGKSQRHRSHGCVRVEDALGFAQMLADEQGLSEAWATAQAAGEQQFVPLKTSIPVRLIYRNTFVDGDGKVAFRTDPYGWNAPIAKALGLGDSIQAKVASDAIDIAP